ncbi:YlxR family protein [Synechococcus sp. PCC 7336]|uniref:YlxR family protein n=1 Tax=Synechococcus sp. PCC 7336 TaxID=195250 RepID=UPI00034C5505|nr:YlxR family protein [Synechococcus sp. PCC 7336]
MPASQEPVRRCIACGKLAPRHEFFRVVRQFETGQVQLNRGMGRSAYICRELDCLRRSQKKNRLGKALRTPVPPEIYNELQMLFVLDSQIGDR